MNINENITIFKAADNPTPGFNAPLWWFFSSVQHGEYANEIKAIRATTDPEVKARLKKQLPAATISGTFTYRAAASLVNHSGFICVDFDGKENPNITDWISARNEIREIKEVAFCALSASGKGCFAVIPLAYPEQHKSQFEALKRDFLSLGYVIDQTCADVSRLRFLSCDSEAFVNRAAIEYRRIYTPPAPVTPKYIPQYRPVGFDKIYNDARQWLDQRKTFTNGNRNGYITQLAGYLNRFGAPEGFALSKCLEFQQSDFTSKEIEAIVKWAYKNQTWTNKAIQ